MPKRKNERYIPLKNYVTAAIFVGGIILLSLYGFEWYKVYQENKVLESYLIKSNTIRNEIKSLEEIKPIFTEVPDDYFVYISYTGDKKIYEMEKELREVIIDFNLKDKFYFINVTDIMVEDNYIDNLNDNLNLEEQKIEKVPTIVYFKNGEVVKDGIVKRADNNIINAGDFTQFLETKEYKN